MNASEYEQHLAQTNGVQILTWVQPNALLGANGHVTGIALEKTEQAEDGSLKGTGEIVALPADMVFKAVGQTLVQTDLDGTDPMIRNGRIVVDEHRKTSLDKVWAGGDCILGGEDLTVAAVEDGKIAAEAITRALSA